MSVLLFTAGLLLALCCGLWLGAICMSLYYRTRKENQNVDPLDNESVDELLECATMHMHHAQILLDMVENYCEPPQDFLEHDDILVYERIRSFYPTGSVLQ